MEQSFSISEQAIRMGLSQVKLAGRFQRIKGNVEQILDVTHNEQGAKNLAELLIEIPTTERTFAVLGMLKDKDAASIAEVLNSSIDQWFLGGLEGGRGMTSEQLSEQLSLSVQANKISQFESIEMAYKQAWKSAEKGDRILIFGSFHTVEAVLRLN